MNFYTDLSELLPALIDADIYKKMGGGCDKVLNCEPRRREPEPVLLAAATGGAGPLNAITTPLTAPIQIVSVTLDPDKRCGLSVLLDFTTIINLPLAALVRLNFQVRRSINNGPQTAIGPQFTFARSITLLETDPFGFQVFDNNIDGRIITYSVVLATSTTISGTEQAANPAVSILNATLSALGV